MSPGLKPCKLAGKSALLVVNAITKLAYLGAVTGAALKVKRLNDNVAWTGLHLEKSSFSSRDNVCVMLCHDMGDYRKMGAIVEDNALLTVMYIEVICYDVLTEHKAVLEALNGGVSDNDVVILVGRGDKACGVAGIFEKLFSV